MSGRAKKLSGAQMAGGLIGYAVVAALMSDDKNPGPVNFVPMDEAAARATITELRLGPPPAPPPPTGSRDR